MSLTGHFWLGNLKRLLKSSKSTVSGKDIQFDFYFIGVCSYCKKGFSIFQSLIKNCPTWLSGTGITFASMKSTLTTLLRGLNFFSTSSFEHFLNVKISPKKMGKIIFEGSKILTFFDIEI